MSSWLAKRIPGLVGAVLLAVASLAAPIAAEAQQPAVVTRGSGFTGPSGVAVDGNGNIFVADTQNNAVKEVLAPDYTTTVAIGVAANLLQPQGLAVDAAGNVFVADTGHNTIVEILAAGGYVTANTVVTGVPGPAGVAVDVSDNLFIASPSTSSVFIAVQATNWLAVSALGGGFVTPTGVAVDSNENVFVTDPGDTSHQVKEIIANTGYASVQTVTTLGTGLVTGIAVDRSGDVFFGVPNAVSEFTVHGTMVQVLTTLDTPFGVAVDGGGNVYVADQGADQVVELEAATTTVLVAAPNPSAFGASVTLTATVTVSAGTPTGSVTFFDGANAIGTVAPISGVAALSTSTFSLGSHALTASYSGDLDYAPSLSTVVTQVVNPAATTTTLTASLNPSAPGQSVTFTASVSATGGTVTFLDGSTPLDTENLSDGTASFSTAALSTGNHSITAQYSGTANFAASTSAILTQGVGLAASATSLVSSVNPSTLGQTVTFTAFVSATSGVPTGSVTFLDGSTPLGSVPLAGGVAGFSTSGLTAASHTITASYGGDSRFAGSGSGTLTQVVDAAPPVPTQTALVSSLDPSKAGQPVTFTATVTPLGGGTPTGSVTFKDGGATLGTMPLSAGEASFTTSALGTGSHAITALYGGASAFTGSTSSVLTENVQSVGPQSSSTTLAAAPNPSSAGQTVTFTASVVSAGGNPTGVVAFQDGDTALGSVSLVAGKANFSTTALAIGAHAITALYDGDSTFAASLSQTIVETVASAAVPGEVYDYQNTLGAAGTAHFNSPVPGVVDAANGRLFIADPGNDQVQVLDTGTLAAVATIGIAGVAGADNAHLDQPGGVGLDPAAGRLFVADTANQRVQIFDTKNLAYLATLGTSGAMGSDASHFDQPASAFVNAAAHLLYVADTGNHRVQIFDTSSLALVATLGTAGVAGADTAHLDAPQDAEFDPSTNQILVADTGNQRIQIFDAASFAYVRTLGVTGTAGFDNGHFAQPRTVGFDPVSDLVLVADAGANARIQAFDGLSYAYVLTLGTVGSAGAANTQFAAPQGLAVDPVHDRLFIGDGPNNRVQIFAIMPVATLASVLPGSRSVQLGTPATLFATMLNTGSGALEGCRIALPATAPAGLSLDYQTTDPTTNALTGTQDTPATIPGGDGAQSFLVTLQGTAALSAPALALDFDCSGAAPAAVVPGVDTVDLTLSNSPIADIIALSATPSGNGIVAVPANGAAAFAVASVNVGAAAPITVSADTGAATLPLALVLCESNPGTGQCLAPPAATVSLTDAAGATPTFSVFVQASGPIALAPAVSRIFVRFKDSGGGLHGSTSVAVETE